MTSSNFKPGDLIGFSSWDWTGVIINLFTYGIPLVDLSHVGILAHYQGELALYESTTLCPIACKAQGKVVNGTQVHLLPDRISHFYGRVYHYPLLRQLSIDSEIRLSTFLASEIGRPYDFIGAFRSSGKIYSYLESLFRDSDDSTLYCSEWCAIAHREIGIFHTRNASKWSPNALVRAEFEQETIGGRVRLK